MTRIVLLTGGPGVGKTTALLKVILRLKERGLTVGGVVSRDIRERGRRTGFEIMDVATERRGILSSEKLAVGPRIGRYRVNLKDLKDVAAPALHHAVQSSDVVVCDEVGPMELFSSEFRRAVKEIASSTKPAVLVVHARLRDQLLDELRSLPDALEITVTAEDRDEVPSRVLDALEGRLAA